MEKADGSSRRDGTQSIGVDCHWGQWSSSNGVSALKTACVNCSNMSIRISLNDLMIALFMPEKIFVSKQRIVFIAFVQMQRYCRYSWLEYAN